MQQLTQQFHRQLLLLYKATCFDINFLFPSILFNVISQQPTMPFHICSYTVQASYYSKCYPASLSTILPMWPQTACVATFSSCYSSSERNLNEVPVNLPTNLYSNRSIFLLKGSFKHSSNEKDASRILTEFSAEPLSLA